MKRGFYSKLAFNGIKNNRRFYIPYILAGIGMVMMFYIILGMSMSDNFDNMRGGSSVKFVLSLGSFVIAVFSVIFLFYTNSFLVKQRRKEFGLYNILGMSKKNVSRILITESLMIAATVLISGLALGIIFSKLAEAFAYKLLDSTAPFKLSISLPSIKYSVIIYVVIYLVMLVFEIGKVSLSNPIEMLKSGAVGEKPPKANFFFAFVGFAILAGAYYIALTCTNPIASMLMFFVAVIMVIVATYILFITGSVAICKVLQKKKEYYYIPEHFVSVSQMAYRMKRNGAGLAGICILCTMVLVMLSSTTGLYVGAKDAVNKLYPRDFRFQLTIDRDQINDEETFERLKEHVYKAVGGEKTESYECTLIHYSGTREDNHITFDRSDNIDVFTSKNVLVAYFISLEDYNKMTGNRFTLGKDEVLLDVQNGSFSAKQLYLNEKICMNVAGKVDNPPIGEGLTMMAETFYIVVPDLSVVADDLSSLNIPEERTTYAHYVCFNSSLPAEEQCEFIKSSSYGGFEARYKALNLSLREDVSSEFFGMYGGLFFLGIVLSVMFICATVLIIYYKQVSEGYEDEDRFRIMRNVGMTEREIRRSINSQVKTVFYLPYLAAGVHLGFAFPMIVRIIRVFGINNLPLLIITNMVSFVAIGILYTIIYKKTSSSYFKIVNGIK